MQGRSQKKLMTEAICPWLSSLPGIKSVYNDYKQQKWKKLLRQVPWLACY